jgi:hypothetical protein
MRKYISFILLAALSLVWVSCINEDDPTPASRLEVSTPRVAAVEQGFYNLLDLNNAFSEFKLELQGSAPISKVEVYQSFKGSAPSLVTTITDFPSNVKINLSDAAAAAGVDPATLVPGDNFLYTFKVYTPSGEAVNTSTSLVVSSSCPSTIPTGTYSAVSGGTSTDGCPNPNPVTNLPYEVTLTDLGAGKYRVSDFSAGVYQSWYGACYGYTFETAGTLTDICGTITLAGTDAFSSTITGTGSYNAETGVITYSFRNGFGDTGNVQLTKK